jgi:hypothetical protein
MTDANRGEAALDLSSQAAPRQGLLSNPEQLRSLAAWLVEQEAEEAACGPGN